MTVLVINGKTIRPQKGKTAKIKINKNDQVELLDDNGNFSQSLTMQESGEDLIIYGENGQPEFVLVQYQNAPELAALVPPAGETVATSEAVLASQTGISKSTMVLGGLLALAAGGVAAGAGGGGGGGSSDKPVVDPNNPDNYLPSLKLGKSEVSIKENQKGEIITTVKADDADGDQVSYSVNDSRFEIDSKGNLKLKAGNALDFEKEKTINLTITAKDAKGGTTTKNLKINVQDDVSDNPNSVPELTLSASEVAVKENVYGATITTVKATDKDGDKISYSVNDNRFEVDNKGNLKLKSGQSFDYEKEKAVNVTVTAKDAKGASVSKTVKINVENVNEKPDLDVGKDEVTVKENIQGATVTTVKFSDPDGDKPSYTVSDNRFEVVSGNLKLKDGVALDYEKEKTVTVKITAKDGKGLEDSETVKINVSNDTADDPITPKPNQKPVWTSATETTTVKENAAGANIATKATASDPDKDALTYTVSDNRFEVDNKGNLKLKAGQSLDHETAKTVTVKVTATDSKGLSAVKTVTINVEDVNEKPELTLGKSEVSIKENVYGATITTVKATDPEGDKIAYTVNDDRFEVDSKGNLKLKAGQSLDYEEAKTVSVKVTASDGKLSDAKEVKITVQDDASDNAKHSDQILPVVKVKASATKDNLLVNPKEVCFFDSKGNIIYDAIWADKDGKIHHKDVIAKGKSYEDIVKEIKAYAKSDDIVMKDIVLKTKEITLTGTVESKETVDSVKIYIDHSDGIHDFQVEEVAVKNGQFSYTFKPHISYLDATGERGLVNYNHIEITATTKGSQATSGTNLSFILPEDGHLVSYSYNPLTGEHGITQEIKDPDSHDWFADDDRVYHSSWENYLSGKVNYFICMDEDYGSGSSIYNYGEVFLSSNFKYSATALPKELTLSNAQGGEFVFKNLPDTYYIRDPDDYSSMQTTYMNSFVLTGNAKNLDLSDLDKDFKVHQFKGPGQFDKEYQYSSADADAHSCFDDDGLVVLLGNEKDNVLTAPQGFGVGGLFISSGGNDVFVLNPNQGAVIGTDRHNYGGDNPSKIYLHNEIEFISPLDGSVAEIQNFNPEWDELFFNGSVFNNLLGSDGSNERYGEKLGDLLGSYFLYDKNKGELSYDFSGTGNHDTSVLFARFTDNPILDNVVFSAYSF